MLCFRTLDIDPSVSPCGEPAPFTQGSLGRSRARRSYNAKSGSNEPLFYIYFLYPPNDLPRQYHCQQGIADLAKRDIAK